MRLLGFERVELEPGESRSVTLAADRRLVTRFDGSAGQWYVAEGTYGVAVGKAADDQQLTGEATLSEARFGR
jgi:beta-glucosidase